ncbi:polyprenyl synthetase family protein [Aquimonas voraii]|uniref:Farnesyl diphosphate synthase n=1 Tax=Aquimonas voraii TaxID=265719 RepID=A0A1G6RU11_9GAMM|nr:farnesyl diphosphate synthase [Aquimonas voraii]SDD08079.1 farnesyl diphosphate synthase [Aquimonas voraii]
MRPEARLRAWAERSESVLAGLLPNPTDEPRRLHEAMRYASLGGGKRMRPLLVYASGLSCGASEPILDHAAAAVEFIHAYSLVHDDLPAMDDDSLRRGRPTVHIAFDEATAILAGDALQALAFEVLTQAPVEPAIRVELLATLARASGAAGMCGGQALDLAVTGGEQTLDQLKRMHALKTGALIRAAVRMGALCAGAEAATLATLDAYASALGLAFQIRDDLLDIEGSAEELGKTPGKDAEQGKPTYPALLGVEGARAALEAQGETMRAALSRLPQPAPELEALAELTLRRSS